eukprot:4476423-Prymnesium_polylepis.2
MSAKHPGVTISVLCVEQGMAEMDHHTYITDPGGATTVTESTAEELAAMSKTASFKKLWKMSG